jgi:long-chain acyl-CoA synthetase
MGRDIRAEREELDREVEGKTLCSVFDERVRESGTAPALWAKDGSGAWQSTSWTEYREQVKAVALGLRALGFSRGSFATILARNRPEHMIADLGVVHAGGTPVSLYTTLAPDQLAYITHHCEARVAFVEDLQFYGKLKEIRAQLPNLQKIVLMTGTVDDPMVVTWDALLAAGRAADPAAFEPMWREVKPDDTLTLIYTSGTTGHPKGVMDTHRSMLWDLTSVRRMVGTTSTDRVISYLPLAHAADRALAYYAGILGGHQTYFCPDLTQVLATLLDVRPTFFGAVPRIWEKLHAGITSGIAKEPDAQKKAFVQGALDAARAVVAVEQTGHTVPNELLARRAAVEPVLAAIRAKIGLDQVKLTVTGAAPTPVEVIELFHAIGIAISEVWGMSELGVVASVNPLHRIKIGSIGVMVPGVEAKIAGDGELLVRGGCVMKGYYKEPDKTAETIDRDGWLATGDVATVDADGYYKIVDRKKELIITAGGKNISPANIEALLKSHPLVGQACAIGDNRPYLTALVVLDGQVVPAWAAARGLSGSLVELAQHPDVVAEIERAVAGVNERLSRVETIRRFTIVPGEWTAESEELTPTLKLKRRVIHAKYAQAIDAMYAER